MKRLVHGFVVVILVSSSVGATDESVGPTGQEIQEAIGKYRSCAISYGERFASTKESPSDIATAAILSCQPLLTNFLARVPFDSQHRETTRSELEEQARRLRSAPCSRGVIQNDRPATVA